MSPLAAAALAASLTAAAAPAAPAALDQILTLLGQKKCDEAFELVAKAEVPNPSTPQSLKAAQAVARGAEACRAADPIVALSFSSLAKRLAPGDADVATAHAEGLIAVQQKGEAASELDALIAVQPAKKAPKAWMLRAKIAREEGDLDEAVRLLTPLSAEAATKKEAAPLLATAKADLAKRKEVKMPPPQVDPPAKVAEGPKPAGRRHAPGQMVKAFPGQIGLGGELLLKASLEKGQAYVFRASGRCDRQPREMTTTDDNGFVHKVMVKPLDTNGSVFGLDFRVQLGGQDSRALSAGIGESSESKVQFVADADEVSIRVFDSGRPDKDVKCTVGQFSIAAE